MVNVTNSRGKLINIEVRGIQSVIERLRKTGQDIENSMDLTIIKLGGFLEEEVKESIMGNRAEPKSVDTGLLGNNIQANKVGTAHVIIKPKRVRYPNGMNTEDVATFLEYGTTKISPRRHFRNTESRNKKKIVAEIKEAVNKETQKF